jgi:hypothetical protein
MVEAGGAAFQSRKKNFTRSRTQKDAAPEHLTSTQVRDYITPGP